MKDCWLPYMGLVASDMQTLAANTTMKEVKSTYLPAPIVVSGCYGPKMFMAAGHFKVSVATSLAT